MFARIGTWQGSPEDIERWVVRARDEVKPSLRADPGLTAAYWLVDRAAGTGLIVTLWESEAAMRASEAARARRQAGTASATGARVTTERYEVVEQLARAATADPGTLRTRDAHLPPAYSDRLERLSLGPLWTALHTLLPPERGVTRVVPHHWRWGEVRAEVLEAARLVGIEQAERRVLVLCNPGLPGAYAATSTLYAGLQVILPGESAPSHHHTPSALRLIVEGRGAYTTVDGVKCEMEPGDLIITPPMRWHDHGHEGAEPVIWLDGLDIPLVRAVDQSWASRMRPAAPPETSTDSSQDELTAAGLVPRRSRYPDTGYAQVRWPWRRVRCALETLAATTPAEEPVILGYTDPTTGRFPLRTMGAEAQWLRPGEQTRAARRASSGVYLVVEGRGESRIGEATFAWTRGDCLAVPPWHWIEHRNHSDEEPACLFQLTDEPALRALGLWHEEERP